GVFAGLAGVYLSLGFLSGTFAKEMSAGRGFIAIAAYIFGNWNVAGTVIASILFGLFQSIAEFLENRQVEWLLPIPVPGLGWNLLNIVSSEFLGMIPYILTIYVLALSVRKARPPKALGKPYE
ncbi:MAG: ABC transporter permease, partial [Candidatus Hodarchaeota archaeon]